MKRLQAVPDDPASSSADQFTGSTAAMMMMMTVLQQQQQHLDSATRYDSGIASFDDDCLLQQISKLSTGNDFNDTLDTSNDQGSTEYYHSNVAPQQSYINRTALSSNCVDDQNEDGDTWVFWRLQICSSFVFVIACYAIIFMVIGAQLEDQ